MSLRAERRGQPAARGTIQFKPRMVPINGSGLDNGSALESVSPTDLETPHYQYDDIVLSSIWITTQDRMKPALA